MLAVWGTYIWRGLFSECYGILLQPLSDKFLLFSLKIRGLEVRSHRENRARNDTYFAISKRRYFLFAPPPPLPTPGTGPPQTIPHPRARRAGLVTGVARENGNRSKLTMYYWMEAKSRIICTFSSLTRQISVQY